MANIKSIIIVAIACLTSIACQQSPERTIQFAGDWTPEQKQLVIDSTDEWCEKTGDCIVVVEDSPNKIRLTDVVTCNDGDSTDVKESGCTQILTHLESGKVEVNITLNRESFNKSSALHELGHMLTEVFSHVDDENSAMYSKKNSVKHLSELDVDWYYGNTRVNH
jgi:hypothetical protein